MEPFPTKTPPAVAGGAFHFFYSKHGCAALTWCAAGLPVLQNCHGAGDDAAQNAGHQKFGYALHANQQHYEHEGVGSALDGHQILHIVAAVESQHDVAHEEQGVQGGAVMALRM